MTGGQGRLGRLTEAVLGGARAARDKARELRDEFRTTDEPERALVAPLLPGQQVRYVGLAPVRAPELHRAGSQFADRMAEEAAEVVESGSLFALLQVANPVAWVESVMTPVRVVAGMLMLPANAAALAATSGQGTGPEPEHRDGPAAPPTAEPREPIPLTAEQEAFRALFRLSRYRPLADQLAEIAYRRRYVFSGDLATLAGSMLLFLERYTGTPLAVTDTHLHLLRMGRRPDEGRPDRRRPQVLWSVERHRITRIESEQGARLMQFPSTVTFDDGSWIRIVNPATRDDQNRFLAAVRDIPGQRPAS